MRVSRPLAVTLPPSGALFAESVHTAEFQMAWRRDSFHKLVYVLRGKVRSETEEGGGGERGAAGTVFAIPAGARHRLVDEEPATLLLLCFEPSALGAEADEGRLWTAVAGARGRALGLDRGARLRFETTWRRALLEQARPRLGSAFLVRSLAVQTLVHLARLPAAGPSADARARVRELAREVAETFDEAWTIERAAQRAGLSRRRLTALFREEAGASFLNHLTDLRLRHAAELLRSGEHSILGAMFSCGFGDTSHFYRQFRRRFGVPPGEWRGTQAQRSFSSSRVNLRPGWA
jgi:AraC-like DNA-binding protein